MLLLLGSQVLVEEAKTKVEENRGKLISTVKLVPKHHARILSNHQLGELQVIKEQHESGGAAVIQSCQAIALRDWCRRRSPFSTGLSMPSP